MEIREYISLRLREFRSASGLTTTQVGKFLGKSKQAVTAWESGKNMPSAGDMLKLCQLYKVDIRDFYPVEMVELRADEHRLVNNYRVLDEDDAQEIQQIVEYVAGKTLRQRGES
jgi:transcriptional regulator with XRE-family HTH domain